jgi:hypothetical protein
MEEILQRNMDKYKKFIVQWSWSHYTYQYEFELLNESDEVWGVVLRLNSSCVVVVG